MDTVELQGAGGLRLVADVGGPEDGPTILLLHGGGQTRHSWAGTLQTLVDNGWRAMSLDLRGHGDSAWTDNGDYGHLSFADDVTIVARGMSRPPILVGASLGGLASLLALYRAPVQEELASALVLVDVAHRLEVGGRERIGDFMTAHLDGFATLDEAADAIAAYNPHRPRPTDLGGLSKNLRQKEDGRWFWHWDPRFVSGKFALSDEARSVDIGLDQLDAAAAALRVPTLLVRGRSSDLLSAEGAEDFLKRVPHAEFADVAGAGHMVAGDRNEIFNRAILDFVERHRST